MYNWIETTFNVSGGITQAIAVILALAVVLLLFGLFVFVLKRLMGTTSQQSRSRQPRIAVMDTATVDTRRRLVLVRRDNVEHLLLVGGPSDVVVEQSIVRNAPLTAGRPAAHSAPGIPAAAAVKSPMAPGPDIPPRPAERILVEDPTPPPPSIQARPPVPAEPPLEPVSRTVERPVHQPAATASARTPMAPVAPVSAPASAATVSRPSAATLSASNPFVSRPAQAETDPAMGRLDIKAGTKTGSHPASSRAADLLRAATQNGFNRAARAPAFQEAPQAPEQEAASAAAKAPEVRADPAISRTETEMSDAKNVSAFRSLARPFSPRERPSYGNHSITPPASGPASRAKTALQKPIEPVPAQQKVEPTLSSASAAVAEAPGQEEHDTALPVSVLQSGPETVSEAEAAISASTAALQADTADETGELTEERVNTDAETAAAEETSAEAAGGDAELPVEQPSGEDVLAGEAPAASPDNREIDLGLEDLIADEFDALTTAEDKSASLSAGPDGDNGDIETAGEQVPGDQGSEEVATAEPSAAAEAGRTEVRPVARQSPGLGDRNPIEEEMAKILDELGGQTNA